MCNKNIFFLYLSITIFTSLFPVQENASVQKRSMYTSMKENIPFLGAGLMVGGGGLWWKLWYLPTVKANGLKKLYTDFNTAMQQGNTKDILGYSIAIKGKVHISGDLKAKNCHRVWFVFDGNGSNIVASIFYKKDSTSMKEKLKEFIDNNYNQYGSSFFYYDINEKGQESKIESNIFYNQSNEIY